MEFVQAKHHHIWREHYSYNPKSGKEELQYFHCLKCGAIRK